MATMKEQIDIAGTKLSCERSSFASEEGPVTTQATSWLCRQVPGFLVRSSMRIAGTVETDDGPAAIQRKTQTELVGYNGRVINTAANGEPEHAWADFAPGAWVRLKSTTEEAGEDGLVSTVTETHQKLLSVGEEGIQIELTLSGEAGEIHKEILVMNLDDAAEGEDAEGVSP